jgi:hypothetical protein
MIDLKSSLRSQLVRENSNGPPANPGKKTIGCPRPNSVAVTSPNSVEKTRTVAAARNDDTTSCQASGVGQGSDAGAVSIGFSTGFDLSRLVAHCCKFVSAMILRLRLAVR